MNDVGKYTPHCQHCWSNCLGGEHIRKREDGDDITYYLPHESLDSGVGWSPLSECPACGERRQIAQSIRDSVAWVVLKDSTRVDAALYADVLEEDEYRYQKEQLNASDRT